MSVPAVVLRRNGSECAHHNCCYLDRGCPVSMTQKIDMKMSYQGNNFEYIVSAETGGDPESGIEAECDQDGSE
jgi:hypothetical protein